VCRRSVRGARLHDVNVSPQPRAAAQLLHLPLDAAFPSTEAQLASISSLPPTSAKTCLFIHLLIFFFFTAMPHLRRPRDRSMLFEHIASHVEVLMLPRGVRSLSSVAITRVEPRSSEPSISSVAVAGSSALSAERRRRTAAVAVAAATAATSDSRFWSRRLCGDWSDGPRRARPAVGRTAY
jgi:hypothetical protein